MCSTATRYSLGRADLAHARRDAPLDVVLEARPAALAGDHLVARADAEQPVRQRHRPARQRRRQERAGVDSARPARRCARPAPAGTPRPSSAAGRGSSCRRAAGCCTSGARCLIRWFSSASASTTESVTMTSRRCASSSSASMRGLVPLRAEVAAHAVAQHARLADVEGLARLVGVEVDAGLLRQAGDLGLEITDRHGLHCEFWRSPEPFHYSADTTVMTFTGLIGRICMFPLRAIIAPAWRSASTPTSSPSSAC